MSTEANVKFTLSERHAAALFDILMDTIDHLCDKLDLANTSLGQEIVENNRLRTDLNEAKERLEAHKHKPQPPLTKFQAKPMSSHIAQLKQEWPGVLKKSEHMPPILPLDPDGAMTPEALESRIKLAEAMSSNPHIRHDVYVRILPLSATAHGPYTDTITKVLRIGPQGAELEISPGNLWRYERLEAVYPKFKIGDWVFVKNNHDPKPDVVEAYEWDAGGLLYAVKRDHTLYDSDGASVFYGRLFHADDLVYCQRHPEDAGETQEEEPKDAT